MYYVKALLAFALAIYFAINPVKSETLSFGRWDLTCSEAGCGGACYIDQKLSDNVSVSATYYNGNLMMNIYYVRGYHDLPMFLMVDGKKVELEKQRVSSRLKLRSEQTDLIHNAKSVILFIGEEKYDLNVEDYQNAYDHWSSVQQMNQ